jgi:hypothetical protein
MIRPHRTDSKYVQRVEHELAPTYLLDINWSLKYIEYNHTGTIGNAKDRQTDIAIYRDQDLVPIDQNYQVISPSSVDEIWDTRVSNVSAGPIAIVGRTPWDTFSTEIDMGQLVAGDPLRQPQFGFPFDRVSLINELVGDES